MAPSDDFARQLIDLGFEVTLSGNRLTFPFNVPIGLIAGQEVRLGIDVPGDFPATPPSGPHVSPRVGHPGGAVHASPFGPDWEYWSRPFLDWQKTSRTVREYMAHVRTLFGQV